MRYTVERLTDSDSRLHRRGDLFRRRVTQRAHGVQHQLSLRRQPVAPRAQLAVPVVQDRRAGSSSGIAVRRPVGAHAARTSRADRCGCNGSPIAAMSNAHIRSLSTRP